MNANEQKLINWAKDQLCEVAKVVKEGYGDQSKVFKLHADDDNYFLKVGSNLEKERDRLEWLQGKLPVPKVISFTKMNDKDVLLLSAIEGKNLVVLSKEWSPEKVVDKLVMALKQFHAVNPRKCPFGGFEANSWRCLLAQLHL